VSSVKGAHTLRGGIDIRRAQRDRTGGGTRSGQMTFDRTYTRQFSNEPVAPSNLGLSLAAFKLGLPTSASINDTAPSSFHNYWTGAFAQDTWRLGRLTVNAGLRFEYESGVREKNGQMVVGWNETAKNAITERFLDRNTFSQRRDLYTVSGSAIEFGNNRILRDVHKTASQIT
jgi:hypothetical protein